MRRLRPRSRWARVALAITVVATSTVAVVAVRWPWAVAALVEGAPDDTWPADGRFSSHTDLPSMPTPAADDNRVAATAEFDRGFVESGGSAVMVASGADGDIVYVRRADRFPTGTEFNSFSMAKSLVGILVLKSISDGVIDGLDVPVADLWPEAADTDLASVTVGELMDMRSGLAFEKPPGSVGDADIDKKDNVAQFAPTGNLARLHVDGLDAVVDDVRLIEADRGRFSYQNLNTAILGRLLEEVHGTSIDRLLVSQLVEPAEAGPFRWRRYRSEDQVSPYCCIYARPEWWIAIGRHLLANGTDEEPFLSDRWFDHLMGADLTADARHHGVYRSQIRYDILDRDGESVSGPFLYFTGLGGQITYLVPDEELIVVRFGERYQRLHSTIYEVARFEKE